MIRGLDLSKKTLLSEFDLLIPKSSETLAMGYFLDNKLLFKGLKTATFFDLRSASPLIALTTFPTSNLNDE